MDAHKAQFLASDGLVQETLLTFNIIVASQDNSLSNRLGHIKTL